MGCTLGYAGGFQTTINPLNTVITFYHLVIDRICLRYTPGATTTTRHTSYTFFHIKDNNSVFPFGKGIDRADNRTIRVFAMVTAAERKLCFRYSFERYDGKMGYFTKYRAKGKLFIGFAVYHTAIAADTPSAV
jgi:hypothetical protein